MKILAFTDIHGVKKFIDIIKEKAKNVDLLVCAGDITLFEQNIEVVLDLLNDIGKKVLLIPGNHEDALFLETLCEKRKNLLNIHKRIIEINGINFIGHGTGGFSHKNIEFEIWVKQQDLRNKKLVFVHHAPPYKTILDRLSMEHYGNKSYKNFIIQHNPLLAISGHFHETFKLKEKLSNGTLVINPGPEGCILEI